MAGPTDLQAVLDRIDSALRPTLGGGRVADYIPALARVPTRQFGIAMCTVDGARAQAGDASTPFSIQSVSKILGLTLALQAIGEDIWRHVGREPSGDPFNALIQLEHEQGVPRNPFINAGAICVADQLVSRYADPKAALLQLAAQERRRRRHRRDRAAPSGAVRLVTGARCDRQFGRRPSRAGALRRADRAVGVLKNR